MELSKGTKGTEGTDSPDPTPFDDGELYDLLCEQMDYGLDYYVGLARQARGAVLDVACGTGRILLPCLQAGLDIEGVDLFAPMLARLRAKASARGLTPVLHQAGMASFRLARRFALIMIPFNAFVHNLTTEEQLATLKTCRDHLEPGGLLTFDAVFPGLAWIGAASGTRVLEGEFPHPQTGRPVRMWDTRTFDRVLQWQHSYNEVEMLDTEGQVIETHASRTTVRWIYKGEMDLLLRLAGFERWQILGDFDGRALTQETDALIVQAWREK